VKIIDVENMTSEQIKAQRKEAITAAREAGDVAERYVQARLDATLRDEKLAEQGQTIKLLQQSISAATARVQELEAACAKWDAQALQAGEAIDAARKENAAMGERIRCIEAVSKSRRTVLAKLQGLIATELAAE